MIRNTTCRCGKWRCEPRPPTSGPWARGGPDRGGALPAALADRAGPRGAHARGDRDRDRGRAHPAALGRVRAAADRHHRPDPPRLMAQPGRVAGILLAAGEGSRLGQPKALVRLGGKTLAERGAALLREGGAEPVIVVTGAVAVSLPAVFTVQNPDWRTG